MYVSFTEAKEGGVRESGDTYQRAVLNEIELIVGHCGQDPRSTE